MLTISYYAEKANYSEANSKITGVRIATGENIDGDPNAYSGGHWTNATTILTGTPTLTTSWQRFSHTTTAVSNYANSMIIEFRHTPVGTAGTNDYYEITTVLARNWIKKECHLSFSDLTLNDDLWVILMVGLLVLSEYVVKVVQH